jgi:NodT family efflux transporter outer membrane factor (OMF) lipoprotein
MKFFGNSIVYLLTPVLCMVLCGCIKRFQPPTDNQIVDDIPQQFITPDSSDQPISPSELDYWWREFDDPLLSRLIEQGLEENYSLQALRARLLQSLAVARQREADRYPEIFAQLAQTADFNEDRADTYTLFAGFKLSWELDIWQRLADEARAAVLDAAARQEETEDAALLLSSEIGATYFRIIAQNTQLSLLNQQIATNQKTLEVLRLRFSLGNSSLLDVYQQQEQLIATQSGLPIVNAELVGLRNRCAVLLGQVPRHDYITEADKLPPLPPLPALGIPSRLLLDRADLRRVRNRLLAAGYRIDVAKADQLPRIGLDVQAGVRDSGLRADGLFLSLLADILMPVFDAGRREAEVARTQSVYDELRAEFQQGFISAVEEVQTALWQEQYQRELIDIKEDQLKAARDALRESQRGYLQGINDYLPVLTALFSTQRLERELVALRRDLLLIRITLYQALGSTTYLTSFEDAHQSDSPPGNAPHHTNTTPTGSTTS